MCTWGSCPAPCQVHGSVGAVFPVRSLFPGDLAQSQAQGDTGRINKTGSGQLSSPGVSYTVTPTAPSPPWPGCSLQSSAKLGAAQRQEHPRCPVSSRPPPVPRGAQNPGLCLALHGPHSPLRLWPPLELFPRPFRVCAPALYGARPAGFSALSPEAHFLSW